MVLHGDGGIVEHRQEVLLYVPDLRGIPLEAVKYKADMLTVQLQQPGFDYRLGDVVPCNPNASPGGTDRLHHQLHHLIQTAYIPGVLPHKVIIADVLLDHASVGRHLTLIHAPPSLGNRIPSFRFQRGRRGTEGKGFYTW